MPDRDERVLGRRKARLSRVWLRAIEETKQGTQTTLPVFLPPAGMMRLSLRFRAHPQSGTAQIKLASPTVLLPTASCQSHIPLNQPAYRQRASNDQPSSPTSLPPAPPPLLFRRVFAPPPPALTRVTVVHRS